MSFYLLSKDVSFMESGITPIWCCLLGLEHSVKYMVGTQYYLINKVINEFALTLPLPQISSGLDVM